MVYVTKMQPYSSRLVDLLVRAQEKAECKQTLIGVGRVYSGMLRVGQTVQVIGPRHMFQGKQDITEHKIKNLFLLMGSNLKLIDRAPAGCIVGIGGLDNILVKSGTICSSVHCPNFIKQQTISMGLVKVAVQTKEYSEMD